MPHPPLNVFFGDDWMAGAGSSRLVDPSMQAIVSPQSGPLQQFGTLAAIASGITNNASAEVLEALGAVWNIGASTISILQGGGGLQSAQWAAAAIQLLTSRLEAAIAAGAASSQANALQAQWDVASYLVLRRVARARDIPGGANFTSVQPGWKKDYPAAAIPPVPRLKYLVKIADSDPPEFSEVWHRLVLFTPSQATPSNVDFDLSCWSLGGGGCDVPEAASVGLSFLTWPILVEDYSIPWGGGHLVPFVAALTSPTELHVLIRQSDVDALELRMRAVMRDYYRVRPGPPLSERDITVWPDGTYAGATDPRASLGEFVGNAWPVNPYYPGPFSYLKGTTKENAGDANGKPVRRRDGSSEATAIIGTPWLDLPRVSAAFRTIGRWRQCRRACLQYFGGLPTAVQASARKNPDFADAKIAAWGGPNGKAPPPPPRPRPADKLTSGGKA